MRARFLSTYSQLRFCVDTRYRCIVRTSIVRFTLTLEWIFLCTYLNRNFSIHIHFNTFVDDWILSYMPYTWNVARNFYGTSRNSGMCEERRGSELALKKRVAKHKITTDWFTLTMYRSTKINFFAEKSSNIAPPNVYSNRGTLYYDCCNKILHGAKR